MTDDSGRAAIRAAALADETGCLAQRLRVARVDAPTYERIRERARALALAVRQRARHPQGVEALLAEYDLSSQEGVLLMCLAEALLRIPDDETAERLIADRLSRGHWDAHLGSSESLLVNASTWGLLLTGGILSMDTPEDGAEGLLRRLVARLGEPLARTLIRRAMRLLAGQFVMGRDMEEAMRRAGGYPRGTLFSYDCLGEAAMCADDVARYLNAYRDAIARVA